jgi:transposase-like protein
MNKEVGVVDAMRSDQGGKMQEKETLDEKLPGLFEPDTLLPIQYFEAMRKKHLLEGEKRLILSVLEDAVECFMKCIDSSTSKGQRLFRDADEWINLEDKLWVFSFDNVCDMLDINPEYMRRGLRQWKERKLTAMRAAEEARAAAVQEPSAVDQPAADIAQIVAAEAKPAEQRISAKVFTSRTAARKTEPSVAASNRTSARNLRKAHG